MTLICNPEGDFIKSHLLMRDTTPTNFCTMEDACHPGLVHITFLARVG